jgi:hypothetical protein
MSVEHWWNDTDKGKPKYSTWREICFIALCQTQIPRTCDEQSGINKSMLCVDICSETHTNHISAFCGQNVECLCIRPMVHKITIVDFKGEYTMLALMLTASTHRHTCTRINVAHLLTLYLFYSCVQIQLSSKGKYCSYQRC